MTLHNDRKVIHSNDPMNLSSNLVKLGWNCSGRVVGAGGVREVIHAGLDHIEVVGEGGAGAAAALARQHLRQGRRSIVSCLTYEY